MRKVLIINGHPDKESFCHQLALSYQKGVASTDTTCELINLIDLEFSPILKYGYRLVSELEPDLVMMQQKIKEAHRITFVYPTWWSMAPALLKGFIDRTFLPGFAFKYKPNSVLWDKLLKDKTARLIVTMDAPVWYYQLINRRAGDIAMKKGVLEFCGIKPVKINSFGNVKNSSANKREKWLKQVERLGTRDY